MADLRATCFHVHTLRRLHGHDGMYNKVMNSHVYFLGATTRRLLQEIRSQSRWQQAMTTSKPPLDAGCSLDVGL